MNSFTGYRMLRTSLDLSPPSQEEIGSVIRPLPSGSYLDADFKVFSDATHSQYERLPLDVRRNMSMRTLGRSAAVPWTPSLLMAASLSEQSPLRVIGNWPRPTMGPFIIT